jgi:hypothetical protein
MTNRTRKEPEREARPRTAAGSDAVQFELISQEEPWKKEECSANTGSTYLISDKCVKVFQGDS